MPLPRPFGQGPYGTGLYSRNAGVTYDVAGATSVSFAASAIAQLTINPEAVTSITFTVWGHEAITWDTWQPCEPGTWTPAAPCEAGLWPPPPPCEPGIWTPARLT